MHQNYRAELLKPLLHKRDSLMSNSQKILIVLVWISAISHILFVIFTHYIKLINNTVGTIWGLSLAILNIVIGIGLLLTLRKNNKH